MNISATFGLAGAALATGAILALLCSRPKSTGNFETAGQGTAQTQYNPATQTPAVPQAQQHQPVPMPAPYQSRYPWGTNAYIWSIANTPAQPTYQYQMTPWGPQLVQMNPGMPYVSYNYGQSPCNGFNSCMGQLYGTGAPPGYQQYPFGNPYASQIPFVNPYNPTIVAIGPNGQYMTADGRMHSTQSLKYNWNAPTNYHPLMNHYMENHNGCQATREVNLNPMLMGYQQYLQQAGGNPWAQQQQTAYPWENGGYANQGYGQMPQQPQFQQQQPQPQQPQMPYGLPSFQQAYMMKQQMLRQQQMQQSQQQAMSGNMDPWDYARLMNMNPNMVSAQQGNPNTWGTPGGQREAAGGENQQHPFLNQNQSSGPFEPIDPMSFINSLPVNGQPSAKPSTAQQAQFTRPAKKTAKPKKSDSETGVTIEALFRNAQSAADFNAADDDSVIIQGASGITQMRVKKADLPGIISKMQTAPDTLEPTIISEPEPEEVEEPTPVSVPEPVEVTDAEPVEEETESVETPVEVPTQETADEPPKDVMKLELPQYDEELLDVFTPEQLARRASAERAERNRRCTEKAKAWAKLENERRDKAAADKVGLTVEEFRRKSSNYIADLVVVHSKLRLEGVAEKDIDWDELRKHPDIVSEYGDDPQHTWNVSHVTYSDAPFDVDNFEEFDINAE